MGLVFGGISPEHEVSVITALQIAAAMDRSRYRPIPVYIAKNGAWYTGDDLLELSAYADLDALMQRSKPVHMRKGENRKVELVAQEPKRWIGNRSIHTEVHVMFLALHGSAGENGSMQGLCETYGLPYTGSGVFGSAVGMDKVLSKMLCRDQQIPIVPFVAFRESEWMDHEEEQLDTCEALGYPLIVKPARLGSSIGIEYVSNRDALDEAIDAAFRYDNKVVVEFAVPHLREINCAVLGDENHAISSVLEEPLSGEKLLTFQEKYMRSNEGQAGTKGGGAKVAASDGHASGAAVQGMASLDRIIPAPLDDPLTARIQHIGVQVFQLFECAGVARIDFLMNDETGEVFFNEINTIPGSFSFYLWEPSGIPFDELVDRLIQMALDRKAQQNRYVTTYDVNLLAMRAGGSKGKKS